MTSDAPKTETVPCAICGDERTSPVFDFGEIKIVRCERCGHCYTSPRYTAAERKRIYDEEYVSESSDTVLLPTYFGNKELFLQDAHNRLDIIERYVSPPARALDIGAGGGFFLAAAKQRGWDVAGTDLSQAMIDYCKQTFGIELALGLPEDAGLPPGHFDLVTLWHVLEHVEDVRHALGLANSLLRPGGILAVAVPDINSTDARRLGKPDPNLQPEVHLHHFTERSLDALLRQCGFEPLAATRQGGTGVCASTAGSGRLKALISRHASLLRGVRRAVSFVNTVLLRRYHFITVYSRKVRELAAD